MNSDENSPNPTDQQLEDGRQVAEKLKGGLEEHFSDQDGIQLGPTVTGMGILMGHILAEVDRERSQGVMHDFIQTAVAAEEGARQHNAGSPDEDSD